jgi:hypothetical protein
MWETMRSLCSLVRTGANAADHDGARALGHHADSILDEERVDEHRRCAGYFAVDPRDLLRDLEALLVGRQPFGNGAAVKRHRNTSCL